MKQILGSIDRLRTLRFLTGIYGGIKDEMLNFLNVEENMKDTLQHVVDNNQHIKQMKDKINKEKRENTEDI